ncbi:unnamed protein product [Blepharisma stoltei]|uniref:Uncharacterized protein n=1 Tax=Blepharisma stoltei TaxID=1481888 RepID=A0AAU9KBN0_9CILI|nr:unnamed protein product [Blepharisma stoltei]
MIAAKRGFHTILSKPLDYFPSIALVYENIEILSYQALDLGLGWSWSIFLTSFGLRLAAVPLGMLLDKISWEVPKKLQNSVQRAQKSFLLNDLEDDVKRLKLTNLEHNELKRYFNGNIIMRQGILGYLGLSYFRALHHVMDSPQYYEGLINSKFLGIWELQKYDPMFLLPISVGFSSYWLLKNASHPFFIGLSQNSRLALSFLLSVFSIYLPASYIEAWLALALSHTVCKKLLKLKH